MKKYFLYLAIGIIFVGSGFLCGYFLGNLLYEGSFQTNGLSDYVQEEQDISALSEPTQYATLNPTTNLIYYMVKSQENLLCIYEINNGTNHLIKSFEISPDMFPKDDMLQLEKGISANTKEEAFQIVENFTS
ncbi:MAG: hypothetical protein N2171_02165 [Clostridia bacterium]|nr:hypothetical protein [Clostridia bacterium]